MAREQGLEVDTDSFEKHMEQQRERARAAKKSTSLAAGLSGVELPVTDDSLKYQTQECIAAVVAWIDEEGLHTKGQFNNKEKTVGLVLDKTCFYAESGGQVGDSGMIELPGGRFVVESTEKIADCVLHKGRLSAGTAKIGDSANVVIDRNRLSSMKNHTATHILQWALQQVLGDSVKQQGSQVCPEYLRFDFTWPQAMTKDQLKQVEAMVQQKIQSHLPVTCFEMPIDQAKELGAMALFGEKYGDTVRVVAVGANEKDEISMAFRKEFCGGTHVSNTARISGFAIIKEESVSAGVRRITAYTGDGLINYLMERSQVVDELTETLKAPADQIVTRVNKLIDDNKALTKQLKTASQRGATDVLAEAGKLLEAAQKVNGTAVIVGQLPTVPVEQARTAMDSLKKKAESAVIILGIATEDEKVMLLAGVTDDVIKKGVKAGDIVKQIAPIVGGGGGGRPNMAQAGGSDPSKINDALEQGKAMVLEILG